MTGYTPCTCDIFCNVIDNYGDIGVSWRLARQLANECGLAVRLFVDDLASFVRLYPVADAALDIQCCLGVEVRRWDADAFNPLSLVSYGGEGAVGEVENACLTAADMVIDAFGCALPDSYLAAMTAQTVWINLEYLSAEPWVEGCHKLPSPRPPLTRYFFFPGFTAKTGGLLLERDLFVRRDAFLSDTAQQQAYWQSLGFAMPSSDTLKVSLFAYENAALPALFDLWSEGRCKVLCLVPEGRILPEVMRYFADSAGEKQGYTRGNLQVRILPFVEQSRYDELLWACDLNFVRGEDSCVRAQWAGKPFVWQIYPQQDAVHWNKLQAFLHLYSEGLDADSVLALECFWRVWNGGENVREVWQSYADRLMVLGVHARAWAQELSKNNLALNLLDFSQEIGRMRAFEIDGQQT